MKYPNAPIDFSEEDSGLISKVMQSRLRELGIKDGVEAAQYATNLLPGGQLLSVPLSGLEGALGATREQRDYEKTFGTSLGRMAQGGHGVKNAFQRLKNNWKNNMGANVASAGGALAGAALVGSIASGPIGWLIGAGGMLAGGFAGNKVYTKVFNKQAHDPLLLAKQVDKMQRKGQYVPPQLVFATLAANLPDRMGYSVDTMLAATTGTRLFHQALSTPDGMEKIGALMQNKRIDGYIRANTLVSYDPRNPNKNAAEQLAELINARRIKAKDLLYPGVDVLRALAIVQTPVSSGTMQSSVGAMPGVHPIARNMATSGVAVAKSGDAQILPMPSTHHFVRKI